MGRSRLALTHLLPSLLVPGIRSALEQATGLRVYVANVATLGPAAPFLSLSPLMHGAGLMMALLMIAQGTAVVTLPGQQFDPDLALDVGRQRGVSAGAGGAPADH